MKSILGFGLVAFSVILLGAVGGGMDSIPPNNPLAYWFSAVGLAIAGLASGLLGASLLNEGE